MVRELQVKVLSPTQGVKRFVSGFTERAAGAAASGGILGHFGTPRGGARGGGNAV